MAVRVEGLIFAGVGSSDHDGVARFLADALGVELEVSGDVGGCSSPTAARWRSCRPDYVEPPSDTLLGFLVDDVEAATAELAAKGIEPDGELNAGYGFRYRHFRAPDGRRFELLDRRRLRWSLALSILLAVFVLEEPWNWVAVAARRDASSWRRRDS